MLLNIFTIDYSYSCALLFFHDIAHDQAWEELLGYTVLSQGEPARRQHVIVRDLAEEHGS